MGQAYITSLKSFLHFSRLHFHNTWKVLLRTDIWSYNQRHVVYVLFWTSYDFKAKLYKSIFLYLPTFIDLPHHQGSHDAERLTDGRLPARWPTTKFLPLDHLIGRCDRTGCRFYVRRNTSIRWRLVNEWWNWKSWINLNNGLYNYSYICIVK